MRARCSRRRSRRRSGSTRRGVVITWNGRAWISRSTRSRIGCWTSDWRAVPETMPPVRLSPSITHLSAEPGAICAPGGAGYRAQPGKKCWPRRARTAVIYTRVNLHYSVNMSPSRTRTIPFADPRRRGRAVPGARHHGRLGRGDRPGRGADAEDGVQSLRRQGGDRACAGGAGGGRRRRLPRPDGGGDDARTLLETVFLDSAGWCLANPALARIALAPPTPPSLEPPEGRPSFQRLVTDILRLGQAEGTIRRD